MAAPVDIRARVDQENLVLQSVEILRRIAENLSGNKSAECTG
jgi:hypothetical protein